MSEWVSIHVYHPADPGDLVTSCVAPAVTRLVRRGRARGWFFLRYWEGGTHVRVRVATTPELAATVKTELHDAFAGYLARNPAHSTITPGQYAELAAQLARNEGREDYERALLPPGSVLDVAYRPEHDVYGSGATMAAAERHFMESTELAVDILSTATPLDIRRGLALFLGLVTLADYEPDLARLATSFKAVGGNAQQRFAGSDAGSGDTASALHASYAGARERLRRQVHQAWRLVDAGPDGSGGSAAGDRVAAWLASIRRLRIALEDATRRGEFTIAPAGSPYAWYLAQLEPQRRAVASVLLRCAHLLNNRIGVAVPDEMHVAYLTARALADVDDVSAFREG
jgi:hypothetical protein